MYLYNALLTPGGHFGGRDQRRVGYHPTGGVVDGESLWRIISAVVVISGRIGDGVEGWDMCPMLGCGEKRIERPKGEEMMA